MHLINSDDPPFKILTSNTCTNSGAPDQLQFHRFISECFGSNFVLFLNERDGLSK